MVFGVPAISLSCRVLFWGWSSTFLESHCEEALVGCKEAPGQCLHQSLLPCTLGSPLGVGEATQGTPSTQLHHLFCNSNSETGPRTAVRAAGTKGENLSRRRDGHCTQSEIQFAKETSDRG